MRPTLLLFSIALVMMSCGRSATPSSTKDSTTEGSTSYARRADALRKVRELSAAYRKVRDQAFLGEGGIQAMFDTLHEAMLSWSNEWQTIYAFIDAASALPAEQAQDKVAELLAAQNNRFATMVSLRGRIGRAIASARRQLAEAPRIQYSIAGYDDTYRALETSISRLDTSLGRLDEESQLMLNRLDAAAPRIGLALSQRIKGFLLARGIADLDQAIARVESMFLAEALLTPIERHVRERYLEFLSYFHAGRVFRLDIEHNELQVQCTSAAATIDAQPLDVSYRQAAINRIQATCSDAKGKASFLRSSAVSLPRLIASAHQRRLNQAKSACSRTSSQAVNCAMLPWLSQVTSEDIAVMPEQQLRHLELAWDVFELDVKGEEP